MHAWKMKEKNAHQYINICFLKIGIFLDFYKIILCDLLHSKDFVWKKMYKRNQQIFKNLS